MADFSRKRLAQLALRTGAIAFAVTLIVGFSYYRHVAVRQQSTGTSDAGHSVSTPSATPAERNRGVILNSATSTYIGASSSTKGYQGDAPWALHHIAEQPKPQASDNNRVEAKPSPGPYLGATGSTKALMIQGEWAMNWTQPDTSDSETELQKKSTPEGESRAATGAGQ